MKNVRDQVQQNCQCVNVEGHPNTDIGARPLLDENSESKTNTLKHTKYYSI